MTIRLFGTVALIAGTLWGCAESSQDKFMGSCQTSDDCSDFSLLAPYNESDSEAAGAFMQAGCTQRSGILSLAQCDPNNVAGTCTFLHAHFGNSTLEQIAVLTSTNDPNRMPQECEQEGGEWTALVFPAQ